ncbi:MAG: aldo/keto reductase [Gammaproteobacteria bacterium]
MSNALRSLAGNALPAVGLGCMPLSHAYSNQPDDDDGEKLLHHAIDLGYKHFDSARLYGHGHNEALLARVLKTRRDEMFITSKCGIEFTGGKRGIDCSPQAIVKAVEASLQTLEVDFIDLYYLHRRDFTVPIEDSVGTLAALKEEGKIGGIGISEMSADTLRQAHAAHPIDAIQNEYSLWTRNAELGVLNACRELGVAFVAFSPVARGVLASGVKDPLTLEEGDLRRSHPRFNAENWAINATLAEQFDALAIEANVTSAQLALSWVLAQGDFIHVIPGTTSAKHLKENFATLDLQVTKTALDKADALINQSAVAGHRYPEGMRKTIDTEEIT